MIAYYIRDIIERASVFKSGMHAMATKILTKSFQYSENNFVITEVL